MFKKKELSRQEPQLQSKSLVKANDSEKGIFVLGSGCTKCNNLEQAVT